MTSLLSTLQEQTDDGRQLPFSVYSSFHEQKLLNVPITKPLLMVVLSGQKKLGKQSEITCPSDHFIFLADSPAINMRNIPKDNAYLALLIEFEYQDFNGIPLGNSDKPDYLLGETTPALKACLQQFIESATWAPEEIWSLRKKEILMLLYHLGHKGVVAMMGKPKISHKLHDLFHQKGFHENSTELTVGYLCEKLAMSESTLRRKLKSEGTSVQEIKDKARLGLGLHLLQTTQSSIGLIAEQCGYQSQSRFTDRFKGHFGLTPSELRKTKVTD